MCGWMMRAENLEISAYGLKAGCSASELYPRGFDELVVQDGNHSSTSPHGGRALPLSYCTVGSWWSSKFDLNGHALSGNCS
jgi:hypothetical protein